MVVVFRRVRNVPENQYQRDDEASEAFQDFAGAERHYIELALADKPIGAEDVGEPYNFNKEWDNAPFRPTQTPLEQKLTEHRQIKRRKQERRWRLVFRRFRQQLEREGMDRDRERRCAEYSLRNQLWFWACKQLLPRQFYHRFDPQGPTYS